MHYKVFQTEKNVKAGELFVFDSMTCVNSVEPISFFLRSINFPKVLLKAKQIKVWVSF